MDAEKLNDIREYANKIRQRMAEFAEDIIEAGHEPVGIVTKSPVPTGNKTHLWDMGYLIADYDDSVGLLELHRAFLRSIDNTLCQAIDELKKA